jgi:hypothetical protein
MEESTHVDDDASTTSGTAGTAAGATERIAYVRLRIVIAVCGAAVVGGVCGFAHDDLALVGKVCTGYLALLAALARPLRDAGGSAAVVLALGELGGSFGA